MAITAATDGHLVAITAGFAGADCTAMADGMARALCVGAVTIRYTTLSPFVALLAGILILIVPRLLNYIVAVYLILIGIIGLFGV